MPPQTAEEQVAEDAANTVPACWFRRVCAVRVIREVSPAKLFGRHGDAVLSVIAAAASLSPQEAESLSLHRTVEADRAYDMAMARWNGEQPEGAPSRGMEVYNSAHGSPINHGLIVTSGLVDLAAAQHGAATYEVSDMDDLDGAELVLSPVWRDANRTLCQAALAMGAPELVGPDTALLIAPWLKVFGHHAGSA